MKAHEKVSELSQKVQDTLPNLIGKNCVYVDLPYYANVGDVLIWEGTESFLKKNHINIIYSGSWDTFDFRPLPKEVPIVMQGGGNFGDIWNPPQQFRLKVIDHYPHNKIIILPQTIFYESKERMIADAEVFAQHHNLIICARDENSYRIAKENFRNDVLCLPDMAFCIPSDTINKYAKSANNGSSLFIRRKDKEYKPFDIDNLVPTDAEERDWPPLENERDYLHFMHSLIKQRNRLACLGLSRLPDWYARYILRPRTVRIGVEFLSQYEHIYSTRLHAAILSVLLNKPCVFIDNSYDKNHSFYHTWLSDVDQIKFYE